jgi:hypothetical protein
VPLLVLVGGVSPAVRSVADGAPASQVAALGRGLLALGRAAVPCALAVLAIAAGSLALVIPGLALFVLLALTGAHAATGAGLPAPLTASVATVRPRFAAVAGILGLSIAVTFGGVYLLQRQLPIPLPKTPSPQLLANFRLFARYAIAGVVLAAPLPAIALAAVAARARPSGPA